MILKNYLLITSLVFVFHFANGQIIKDSVRVTSHPVSQINEILDSCRKILHYNKHEVKNLAFDAKFELDFFKQTFKNKVLYSFEAFRCCNFNVSNKKQSPHLGINEFIYKDKSLATKAYQYILSRHGYPLSEFLMDYKPFQRGSSVFIILSETPTEPSVKKLLKYYN